MKSPNCSHYWTSDYYGPRGTCKSIHAVRELVATLRWLHKLYTKKPGLHRAIVLTNFKLSEELERTYLGRDLFYFDDDDLETLRWCPREACWRGPEKHKLHGAYVFVDDVSNLLPAQDWASVPPWLRKMLIKGRKAGLHFVFTMVDAFDQPIQLRRCTDVAYRFRNRWKTRDPDETMPPLKHIFGWYQRRRVNADMLWKYGDLPEQVIQLRKIQQEELHEKLREMEKAYAIVYDDSWAGAIHFFNRSGRFPNWRFLRGLRVSSTDNYDTHQDVAPDDE